MRDNDDVDLVCLSELGGHREGMGGRAFHELVRPVFPPRQTLARGARGCLWNERRPVLPQGKSGVAECSAEKRADVVRNEFEITSALPGGANRPAAAGPIVGNLRAICGQTSCPAKAQRKTTIQKATGLLGVKKDACLLPVACVLVGDFNLSWDEALEVISRDSTARPAPRAPERWVRWVTRRR